MSPFEFKICVWPMHLIRKNKILRSTGMSGSVYQMDRYGNANVMTAQFGGLCSPAVDLKARRANSKIHELYKEFDKINALGE